MHLTDYSVGSIFAFSGITGGLGTAMLFASPPIKVRAVRVLFWAAALSFGSTGIVWSATSEGQALWVQMVVAAAAAAVAAAGLTWGLWELRGRAAHEAAPYGTGKATEQRRSTLEATNRSVIDATGAEFPADLSPFARADTDSLIDMPGVKVTRLPDGGLLVNPGGATTTRSFPPPTGEFSQFSTANLTEKLQEIIGALRALDAEQTPAYQEIMRKYAGQYVGLPAPKGMDDEWRALSDRYRPANTRFAKIAQSIASECMVRIGSLEASAMSHAAQSGVGIVLQAKFAGPRPAFYAAEFLDALSRRLQA
jgi:hypothetical protein